jgi:molybdopterin-guanine dinucleotide biosynthesis protein A
MGEEKAFLVLRGRTLLERVLDGLRPVCDELVVAVAKGDGARFSSFLGTQSRVVEDSVIDRGPIEGLRAGLAAARGGKVAVAPSDAPLITPALYRLLISLSRGYDGAVPFPCGLPEPLIAVYSRKPMLAAVEEVVAGGGRRPVLACGRLHIRNVDGRELAGLPGPPGAFTNINTPADLRRLETASGPRAGGLTGRGASRSGTGSCRYGAKRGPR